MMKIKFTIFAMFCVFAMKAQVLIPIENTLTDFNFLSKEVKDKRIVCIGELAHGYESVNEVKSKIAEYLIKNEGFSVVLFEMPMNAVYDANLSAKTSKDWLTQASYRAWKTESVLKMLENIKETPNLKLHGFDIRRGVGHNFVQFLEPFALPQELIKKVFIADSINQSLFLKFRLELIPEAKQVELTFKELKDYLTIHRSQFSVSKEVYENIIQCVASNLAHAHFLQNEVNYTRNMKATNTMRDSLNSVNVKWLLDKYPNEKIIIWAAGTHISKEGTDFKSSIEHLDESTLKNTYCLEIYFKDKSTVDLIKWYHKYRKDLMQNHVFLNKISEREQKQFDAVMLVSGMKQIEDYFIHK
jgi:erythromycin esterase-like protein